MPAERDGLSERGDEFFAIGTAAEVLAQLRAKGTRQFIVDVGGQLPQDGHTASFAVTMGLGRFLSS